MSEIYISYDIEADGPIPGPNSMLALGAVAIRRDGTELGEFYATIQPLPGAKMSPVTKKEFWDKQPAAWAEVNRSPEPPQQVMESYQRWLKTLGGQPVHVAYPSGFDFTWVRWYMCRYVVENWDFAGMDMNSMASVILDIPYNLSWKPYFPKAWLCHNPFPHHALEDAKQQAFMLTEMFKWQDLLHDNANNYLGTIR